MQFKPFPLQIDCYTSGCKTLRLCCSAWEFNISFLKKQHIFARPLIDFNKPATIIGLSAEFHLCWTCFITSEMWRVYCLQLKNQLLSSARICPQSLFTSTGKIIWVKLELIELFHPHVGWKFHLFQVISTGSYWVTVSPHLIPLI